MSSLANATEAGVPLAQEVEATAPELASAIDAAPGFLGTTPRSRSTTPGRRSTSRAACSRQASRRSKPTRLGGDGAFDLAPAVSNLLTGVLGGDETIKALFGDDGKGTASGTLDRFGLGAVSNEPGNQLFYPASNANRNMFRISAVFNCTMFGVPVEPDCLLRHPRAERRSARRERRLRAKKARRPGGRGAAATSRGRLTFLSLRSTCQATAVDPGGLNDILDDTVPNLPGIGNGGGKGDKGGGEDNGPKGLDAGKPQDLLDFLFNP